MKRYTVSPTRPIESETGLYVRYEDAAEIEEKLERAIAILKGLNLHSVVEIINTNKIPARVAD